MKTYLDVPFVEKEEAKSLGAKWDSKKEKWYAPNGESVLTKRWPDNRNQPLIELKGENPLYGGNFLFVDLIPESCWFTNVRYCVDSRDWDRLRKFIYARAGFKCECCAADSRLEAHERWHYDFSNKVQKLIRLIALCKPCHEATHFGMAQVRNRQEHALSHLMKVNKITRKEALSHVEEAFRCWEFRSQFDWELDIKIIEDSGIKTLREVKKENRKEIAENILNKRASFLGFRKEKSEKEKERVYEEIVVPVSEELKEITGSAWSVKDFQESLSTQYFQFIKQEFKVSNTIVYKLKQSKIAWIFLFFVLGILFFQVAHIPKSEKNKQQTDQVKSVKRSSVSNQANKKSFNNKNKKLQSEPKKKKGSELESMVDFIQGNGIKKL